MPGGRAFNIIILAIFIDVVGFGMIVPVLPYLNFVYGGDTFTGTGLISIYALMVFVGGPIWGKLSDRYGRRPTMMATFLGAVFANLSLAHADSLLMLYIARGFAGLMAGNVAIALATAADLTTHHDRGKAMGFIGAAFGLGFALGPGIGGFFSGTSTNPDISIPAYFAMLASFVALVLTYLWFPETKNDGLDTEPDLENPTTPPEPLHVSGEKHSLKDLLWPLPNAVIFIFFMICAMAQSATFSITPFWATAVLGWDQKQVGLLLMETGISVAFVQAVAVGPLFQKFGEVKTIILGCSLSIIGSLIMLGNAGVYQVYTGLPLIFSGLTVSFPALNSLLSKRTSRKIQGEAMGFSNGMGAIGRVIGPLVAGFVFIAYSPDVPFMMVILLCLVTIIWGYWEIHRKKL